MWVDTAFENITFYKLNVHSAAKPLTPDCEDALGKHSSKSSVGHL